MAAQIRLDGEALKQRAEQAGHYTQEAIAEHAGVGRSALSRLFQGLSMPKVDTLIALRDAYGFPSVDSLLLGAEPPAASAQAEAA